MVGGQEPATVKVEVGAVGGVVLQDRPPAGLHYLDLPAESVVVGRVLVRATAGRLVVE